MPLPNYIKILLISGIFFLLPILTSAQTVYTTPPPPSYLNASATASTVNLNWGNVSTATHYNVQRATSLTATVWDSACSTEGSGSTSCSDSPPSGSYYYRVEACMSGNGCSGTWNNQYAFTANAVTVGSSSSCTGLTLTTNKTSYIVGEDLSYTWSCVPAGTYSSYVGINLLKPDGTDITYNSCSNCTGNYGGLGGATSFGTSNLTPGSYTLRACLNSLCSPVSASASFTMQSGSLIQPALTVTATGMTANLVWTDPTGNAETGFKIFRRYVGSSWSDTPLYYQPPNITTYVDNVTTSGNYEYKVQAYTTTSSIDSNTVSVSLGNSGGSGLVAPYITYTANGMQAVLYWQDQNSTETGYRIFRKLSTGSWTDTPLTTLGANVETFADTMPTVSTYNYKVQVYSGTTSLDSNSVAVTANSGGSNNLYPPTSVTAMQSGSAINVTWTVPASAPMYRIQRSISGAAYTTLSENNTTLTYTDSSSLTSGSTYKYRVYSCSAVGTCSTTGMESAAITYAGGGTNTPITLAAPATLTATVSGNSATLTWPSVSGATYYKVTRKTETATTWTQVCGGAITGAMCTDYSVPAGTYKYGIESCNDSGCSGTNNNLWTYSPFITITSTSSGIPAAPSNLYVQSATSSSIYLKWTDNAATEDKFNIERKLTSADWTGALNVQLQGANITTYTDNSVTSGATYDYRVQACLSGTGCSEYTQLSGVTAGTATVTMQSVLVKTLTGTIVPSGLVAFVKDGFSITANFNNTSNTTVYLYPGTYLMQPSFPAVASTEVQLTGTNVTNNQITVSSSTGAIVYVALPARQSVSVKVSSSLGQVISGAHVAAGITGSTAYIDADTDGSGVAWLQLMSGAYQVLVNKPGFLTRSLAIEVGTSGTDVNVVLEPLLVNVTGQVLAGASPIASAVVRAVNTSSGAIVVVSTNDTGQYNISLKTGEWILRAVADGYYESEAVSVTLGNTALTKNLSLGVMKQLVSSSANIVPTVSVTVTAAELGVAVGLPANALGGGAQATVTIRESTQAVATPVASPLPASVRDVSASSGGSSVTALNSAASIELSYTDSDLANIGVSAANTNNLKIAFWNNTRSDWEVLDSVVDIANKKVRAATNHFTLFAIVLPFLAQPASAENSTTTTTSTTSTTTTTTTDERAVQFATIVAEGTKVYVSGPDALAMSISKSRDTALEQKYDADIVARVIGSDNVAAGNRTTILNFVTYGTVSTVHLGAGERGGVVASFRAAYGHLPQSEYEWQEILKVANGRWPGSLLQERELNMKNSFKKIYLREPVVTQANDSAALAIMAYGLRSAKRNLSSEAAAINTFKFIYGYSPASASDWDAVRAVAYSGAKR